MCRTPRAPGAPFASPFAAGPSGSVTNSQPPSVLAAGWWPADPSVVLLHDLRRRVADLEAEVTRLQPVVEEVEGDSRNWFEVLWTV